MMEQSTRGPRAAIITGSSSGLGASLANVLSARGWSLMCWADDAKDSVEPIREGAWRIVRRRDLSDPDGEAEMVADFVTRTGRLDALVNNAAVQLLGTVEELSHEDWNKSVAVNLSAPFRLSKHAVPHMRISGGGVILNVTSVHANATGARRTAYAATKAGLLGLTRAMAVDHGPDNIRAIAISPGPFATAKLNEGVANLYPDLDQDSALRAYAARLPSRRVGRPEEFATFAALLLEDDATFLNGTEITIDGGLSARLAVGE